MTAQRHEDLVLKKQLLKKERAFACSSRPLGRCLSNTANFRMGRENVGSLPVHIGKVCSNLGFNIIYSICEYLRTIKTKNKHHLAKLKSTLGSSHAPAPTSTVFRL